LLWVQDWVQAWLWTPPDDEPGPDALDKQGYGGPALIADVELDRHAVSVRRAKHEGSGRHQFLPAPAALNFDHTIKR
jgi:hypothetical protein